MNDEVRMRVSVDYLNRGLDFLRDRRLSFSLQERATLLRAGFLRDDDLKTHVIKKTLKQDSRGGYFDLGAYKLYFDIDGDISTCLESDSELSQPDSIVEVICRVIFESFVLQDFLDKSVRPTDGDIVLDIGAYIGSTALLISELIGKHGKAYAFEPVTRSSLNLNMRVNDCSNVEVVPVGVSDSDERMLIHIVHGGVGNMCTVNVRDYTRDKTLPQSAVMNDILEHSTVRMIELTSIDSFCQRRQLDRIDYIKLDVEGMEERALHGAEQTIQEYHPKWSIDSNHMDAHNEPQHLKLVELLERFDYTIKERTQNAHIWAY